MSRKIGIVALCLVVLAAPLQAKPRVRSASVDDQGRARVQVSQRQIFDEIGGNGGLGLDLPKGLVVLKTNLSLPEEAGDISGDGTMGIASDNVSSVGNFTYQPVKRKQLKLDVDYRAVANEDTTTGNHTISVDYPLTFEKVPPAMRDYLAKTSYQIDGHGWWNHYTEAGGKLTIEVHNPDLKKEKHPEINQLHIHLQDANDTQISIHFDMPKDGQLARAMQANPHGIEEEVVNVFRMMNMKPRGIQLTNVKAAGKSVQADLNLAIHDFRADLVELFARFLRLVEPKKFPSQDFLGAMTRLLAVEFDKLEIDVKQQGDHVNVNVDLAARHVDRSILGYMSMMEVLQPLAVEAGTKNHGLSALDKQINALQTNRFKQILIAAGESQDKGESDFSEHISYPKGHLVVKSVFKYSGTVKAFNEAATLMHIPVMHQEYSLLQVHTTKAGLLGHYFLEAQGPWFDSQWALYAEAAKSLKEFQGMVPTGKIQVQDGRIVYDMKKSRIASHGWLQVAQLAPVVKEVVQKGSPNFNADALEVDVKYDAAKWPGKILADLYLQGKNADGARASLQAAFGKEIKIQTGKPVQVPKVTKPGIDVPEALAAEITTDRKTLGVTPWVPPPPKPTPAPTPQKPNRLPVIAGAAVALLLLAVVGVLVSSMRRGGGPPMSAGPDTPKFPARRF